MNGAAGAGKQMRGCLPMATWIFSPDFPMIDEGAPAICCWALWRRFLRLREIIGGMDADT